MMKQKKHVTMIIMVVIFAFISSMGYAAEKSDLVFGAIAVGKVSKTRKSLTPLMRYLEAKTGKTITFETGRDYADTIAKFQSGYFDLGFIGPSPYVIATAGEKGKDVFRIVAGLETNHKPFFQAVIIAGKRDTEINSIQDLNGKRFAFGSRQSTLSCYMPAYMLMKAGVFDSLEEYRFLGKHNIVAKSVGMGKYDGGGIKEAVAASNMRRIKVIAKSDPVYDFLIITHHSMPLALHNQISEAVLPLKDTRILGPIKKGVTGFIKTTDENYQGLRNVMKMVDQRLKP